MRAEEFILFLLKNETGEFRIFETMPPFVATFAGESLLLI